MGFKGVHVDVVWRMLIGMQHCMMEDEACISREAGEAYTTPLFGKEKTFAKSV